MISLIRLSNSFDRAFFVMYSSSRSCKPSSKALFHLAVIVGCGLLGSGGWEVDSEDWVIVSGRDVGKKRAISTWLYVVIMPLLFVAFTVQTIINIQARHNMIGKV
ncbi:hypothetical protein AB4K20DRAFT_1889562 [Rhizopus microsporus]